MPDDWDWFWSSEQGRTRMLRDELSGLQGVASQASSQAARLSSQLASLQGSLETRLSALTTAFDAYVELGDVREQLDGYPDTAWVRRDAAAAIQTLGRGGVPDPVDGRGADYWLADAVNAVIGLVKGAPDPEAETRAVAGSPDAKLFITGAAGALGHGAEVADRVPDLLICDGPLTPSQLAVWEAVRVGTFGDVWSAIGARWGSALDENPAGWADWVLTAARTPSPLEGLQWLDQLSSGEPSGGLTVPAPVSADRLVLDGSQEVAAPAEPSAEAAAAPAEPSPAEAAAAGLRSMTLRLLNRGVGEEAALLGRARVLRATIENPTAPPPPVEVDEPDESRTVTSEVRNAFLAADPASMTRQHLLSWTAPRLAAAAAVLAERTGSTPVETVQVRSRGGSFDVGQTGVDQARLTRADQMLVSLYQVPTRLLAVPGGIAIGFAVLAVIAAIAGIPALVVVALVGAVIAAIACLRAWRRRTAGERSLASDRAATSAALAEGQQRAQHLNQLQHEASTEARRLATSVSGRLSAQTPSAA